MYFQYMFITCSLACLSTVHVCTGKCSYTVCTVNFLVHVDVYQKDVHVVHCMHVSVRRKTRTVTVRVHSHVRVRVLLYIY